MFLLIILPVFIVKKPIQNVEINKVHLKQVLTVAVNKFMIEDIILNH